MKAEALNRAVSLTNNGHMGLGPRCTQPGDIVAILYSLPTPMLLRPSQDCRDFRLLGTSYVYGIMDGEVVRRHKESWAEDTVFNIV